MGLFLQTVRQLPTEIARTSRRASPNAETPNAKKPPLALHSKANPGHAWSADPPGTAAKAHAAAAANASPKPASNPKRAARAPLNLLALPAA